MAVRYEVNMEKIVVSTGMRRNLVYLKANLVILWKRVIEYKANFFMYAIEHVLYMGSFLFFMDILYNLFFHTLEWDFKDYVLFFVLADWIVAFGGTFCFKTQHIIEQILRGTFNLHLYRPINRFLSYLFADFNLDLAIYALMNPILHIGALIYFEVDLQNVFYGALFWFLILVLFIALFNFVDSLNLIKVKITESFDVFLDTMTFETSRNYPFHFFKSFENRILLFFIGPLFFVGSLVVPILRGYDIWNFWLQAGILLGLIIAFSLGTFINWRVGLKRYEAFG